MALAVVDFETTFQFEAGPPKTFQFKDTTDYAGQGVALADVTGVLKVVSPDGLTSYNNLGNHGAPDIDPDVSLINTITITLPLDGNGNPQQGDHVITYEVQDTSGAPFEITNVKTLDLQYVSPVVDLDMIVNCSTPLLTSTDNTPYTVSGVDPVIVRDHQILYPASTGTAPVVGTSKVLSTAVFFTIANQDLQHSSSLVSTLTYTFASDFIVTDSISGNGFIDVNCDAQLCDIYCCLRAQYDRYLDSLLTNTTQAEREFRTWDEMVGIAHQIDIAQECGKGDDVSALVSRLLKLGNCEPGCGCDDGEPQLVVGLGGGTGVVVVDSGGTPVIVVPVINGNTTTYTVSLASAFVDKVNNSFNSTVTAGTDVTITTTIDGNGNKTFKVDFTSSLTEPDILTFLVDIALAPGTLPVVTVSEVSVSGSAFLLATPTVENLITASIALFTGVNTKFKVDNIWDNQGALQFKADIEIVDLLFTTVGIFGPSPIIVEMFDNNSTDISFRFRALSGNIATGGIISIYDNIKLQVTLHA